MCLVANQAYESTTLVATSVFSRSNTASWRRGERTARLASLLSGQARRAPTGAVPRGQAHPGVRNDRRQVDVLAEVRPVEDRRVEAELLPLSGVELVVKPEQPVDTEHGLGLGVSAVQLDVAQGALSLLATFLHPGGEVGLLAP